MASFSLSESPRRHAIAVVAAASIVGVADRVLDGGGRPETPLGCG